MGYGRRALDILHHWYQGEINSVEDDDDDDDDGDDDGDDKNGKKKKKKEKKKNPTKEKKEKRRMWDSMKRDAAISAEEMAELKSETISPRAATAMPPLLNRLSEIIPPRLHYIGVSFGLNSELFSFWKKTGYSPVYLRQTENEITGEYSCIMLKGIILSFLLLLIIICFHVLYHVCLFCLQQR